MIASRVAANHYVSWHYYLSKTRRYFCTRRNDAEALRSGCASYGDTADAVRPGTGPPTLIPIGSVFAFTHLAGLRRLDPTIIALPMLELKGKSHPILLGPVPFVVGKLHTLLKGLVSSEKAQVFRRYLCPELFILDQL
jgi:hypothetical protein